MFCSLSIILTTVCFAYKIYNNLSLEVMPKYVLMFLKCLFLGSLTFWNSYDLIFTEFWKTKKNKIRNSNNHRLKSFLCIEVNQMSDCSKLYACLYVFFVDICMKKYFSYRNSPVLYRESTIRLKQSYEDCVFCAVILNLIVYNILLINCFDFFSCIIGIFGLSIGFFSIIIYVAYESFMISNNQIDKSSKIKWFYTSFVCYSLTLTNLYLSYDGCSSNKAMKSCLPLYVIFFVLFSFLCYFMILKCLKMQTNKVQIDYFYYSYTFLTFTTVLNLLIFGTIVLINKSPRFKHYFHIIGGIGMICGLCSIVTSIYNSYEGYKLVSFQLTKTSIEHIIRNVKCCALGYCTFSKSYELFFLWMWVMYVT